MATTQQQIDRQLALTELAVAEAIAQRYYQRAFSDLRAGITSDAGTLALAAEGLILDLRGRIYTGGTYVSDGGTADRSGWCIDSGGCRISEADDPYYEAYDIAGQRTAHGYICAACRRITQTG